MKPKSPLTMKLVSALKHKPWAPAHKERAAHPATPEAHNVAPTKKYVSDAQRKAVHASKADGGKGAPTKLKKGKGVMIDGKEYPKGYTKKDVAFLKKQKEDVVRYEDLDAKGKAIYDAKRKKKKSPAKLKEAKTEVPQPTVRTRPTPKKKRPVPARPKRQLGTGAKGLPSSEYLKKSSSGQGPRSKNYNLNRIPYGK